MAPTDADKIALLTTAIDRLILTMQYGQYQDKIDALHAAADAKRIALLTPGSLSDPEIARIREAPATNQEAVAKFAPTFVRMVDELLQLRRRDADHVFGEKVLRDRIRECEQQLEQLQDGGAG